MSDANDRSRLLDTVKNEESAAAQGFGSSPGKEVYQIQFYADVGGSDDRFALARSRDSQGSMGFTPSDQSEYLGTPRLDTINLGSSSVEMVSEGRNQCGSSEMYENSH